MKFKKIMKAPVKFLRGGLLPMMALFLVAGCAVGPNYKRPAVNAPDNFRFAESQTTNSLADLPWWEVFKDPMLQDLIRTALTNNYDLKQAVARVEQARNQVIVARSAFFPANRLQRRRRARPQRALTIRPRPRTAPRTVPRWPRLSAFWEIDFWGRIRRLSEAARAQYLATDEARRGVTITLVSDVATSYFQLLDLDRELEIQRAATNAYAGSYRIFNDRLINGVASKLETDRAAAALANAAAIIPQLGNPDRDHGEPAQRPARAQSRPGAAHGPWPNQPQPAPEIPAGLPSALLRRRPDVVAAEQSLIAANANIGVSVANFFPQIGLTTFLGRASPELSAFTGGAGNLWNVGGTLTGPIFQGGQLRAQYRAPKAQFDEAKAAYQQTVLTAFQDVSDALITRQKLAEEKVSTRRP